ncbi:hypothetical protein MCQ_01682 [Candidatus Bartonella washoeensis Sb944nv]|uniref:Clp ATPase C-terminal domain-containing protein n=1 Tax=Candidatus Bartonella washoeensis Sb944nv TaxID=1094563 RepID=J0PVQ9_9HYPH|nr:hypothetical protein MCQ_01682 [Bartonella washoeensis Sb944nv]
MPEGQTTDQAKNDVMNVVKAAFRPEFLNRIDEIILFQRLQRHDMEAIVDIQIKQLQNLLNERKITLQIEPEVRQFLANKGYDPLYGARPLKRIIQKEIQDPMAEDILFGNIPDETTVKITKQGDRLVFSPITQK